VDLLPHEILPFGLTFGLIVAQHISDQPAHRSHRLYGGLAEEEVANDLPAHSSRDGYQEYPLEADQPRYHEGYCSTYEPKMIMPTLQTRKW